jgi:hypothetical protein
MNKLKIFQYPAIDQYEKVMFLDSDVLAHTSLIPYFEKIVRPGYLYCYSESTNPEDNAMEYWSFNTYTAAEIARFVRENILPFNAGTFAFINCDAMKEHFNHILRMVSTHRGEFFYEQSFMNVYFNRINMTDRTVFTDDTYMMHNIPDTVELIAYPGKLIHFAGGPSEGDKKIVKMRKYSRSFLGDTSIILFDTRDEMVQTLVPKGGKYAEVGVFEGRFSDKLCKILFPNHLVLLDRFEGMCESGDQDGNNVRTADLNRVYTELMKHMSLYPDMMTVMKGDSSQLLETFPDDSFDMIYLDGDHSYEGVKKDLLVSYRKIKNRGMLMGHDYEMNMKKARTVYHFGVKQAVDEFCETHNQTILAKGLDGCVSYAIQLKKN